MKLTVTAFILIAISFFSITSCTTYKNIPYFTDIPDTTRDTKVQLTGFNSPLIQPDDILAISIVTLDAEANILFNKSSVAFPAAGSSTATPIGQQVLTGYLVDKAGFVQLPVVGKIQLQGLTTADARDTIFKKISFYYSEPSVDVRFANFKITVLGEVNRPATYTAPNEKITLFDALGMAGDLTIFGKRENVMLIRDENDKQKHIIKIDLNSKQLMNSPYFYLKQNDVIYVEPNKAKLASLDASKNRNYVIVGTVLSVLLVLATRIK